MMAAAIASCSTIALCHDLPVSKWPPSRLNRGRGANRGSPAPSRSAPRCRWPARSRHGRRGRHRAASRRARPGRASRRARSRSPRGRPAWPCAASAAVSPSTTRRARISSSGPQPSASAGTARRARAVQHVDAGAGAHLDPAFDLQRDQRLAHRRPADAELLRQVALGRQPRADREFAGGDQRAQLVGDLAVEALRFEGLQRHGGDLQALRVVLNWTGGQANSEYGPPRRAAIGRNPERCADRRALRTRAKETPCDSEERRSW